MKISARNQLKGTVQAIRDGAVNSEIVVELPSGQQIVAIITKESVERLGLAVGREVYALVKASDVLLAVD